EPGSRWSRLRPAHSYHVPARMRKVASTARPPTAPAHQPRQAQDHRPPAAGPPTPPREPTPVPSLMARTVASGLGRRYRMSLIVVHLSLVECRKVWWAGQQPHNQSYRYSGLPVLHRAFVQRLHDPRADLDELAQLLAMILDLE